ncbi:LINE-1 retrotransposable element ORF2 protein [Cucumis melo var. makuwa]|uniref:LINE-1 retrotransposable element ORF2 protein n=1 Tax=Cucumis melo var. makuwa TaxID=1194695 RepID=A0A5D3D5Q5_CUCMM|nr:LINE-1 retrotransposable element ORF2 protein [Cucumis melo var. makuwa]
MENLKMAIKLFKMASGLKINPTKSFISPINVDLVRTKETAESWGFTLQNFPIDYLGTPPPLAGKPQSKAFWSNTVEKIHKKLLGWKYTQVSKGGRLTLLNSTLASTPTYLLSLYKAPIQIGKKIERLWRNYL